LSETVVDRIEVTLPLHYPANGAEDNAGRRMGNALAHLQQDVIQGLPLVSVIVCGVRRQLAEGELTRIVGSHRHFRSDLLAAKAKRERRGWLDER